MMEYLSDQNAKDLARSAGTNIAKELMQFMFKEVTLNAVLRHFELQGVHHVSIHFDHSNEGEAHTIVMRHTMGPKWSIFYEELIRSLRSEEHTSELQSHSDLVCRLLLEKKNNKKHIDIN